MPFIVFCINPLRICDILLLNYLEKLTQTAFLFSTQTVDMNGWVLLSGERQELAVSVSPDRGLVEADLRDVPDVYQELHWHAPQSYHGDRVRNRASHPDSSRSDTETANGGGRSDNWISYQISRVVVGFVGLCLRFKG